MRKTDDSSRRDGRILFFLGANAILTALTVLLLFSITHNSRYNSIAVRLMVEVVLADILCVSLLFIHMFHDSIRNSNKLQKIYERIPAEYRPMRREAEIKADQMLDSIMDYHTMLQNKELMLQYTLTQTRLSALQSQINPHFLFNTLESIRGYCLIHQQNEVADLAEALSSLFRNCLQRIDSLVTVRDELDNVGHYMLIQRFRFPGKIDYVQELDGDSRLMNCKLPNLTIQPIIENAIFHGLEERVEAGLIVLKVYLTDRRLIIRVTDNGLGIDDTEIARIQKMLQGDVAVGSEEDARDQGIGMANINARIKLHFGNEYGIAIASTRNVGTQVEITLPILQ